MSKKDKKAKEAGEPKKWHLGTILGYLALPVVIFMMTSIPVFADVSLYITLGLVVLLVAMRFIPARPRGLTIMLWMLFVVFLVGSTNWFLSPFFFALYLAAIGLAFVYTPSVAVAFTVGLLIVFANSSGEVKGSLDYLTLLSLLSVIPISIALRRAFLLVQQEQKGILILETEDKGSGVTSLESILNNQVNRVGVTMRQPITYLKQALAMLDEGKLSREEEKEIVGRMRKSAEEMFTLVKEFERGTTRNSFLKKEDNLAKTITL